MDEVLATIRDMSSKFDALKEDVDKIRRGRSRSRHSSRSGRSRSSTTSYSRRSSPRTRSRSRSRQLSPRRSRSRSPLDTRAVDSDDTAGGDLLTVSQETGHLLTSVCTRSVSNETRKRIRGRYQLPKVVATKSPNLDAFLKPEAPAHAKGLDKELAKIQSFVLDALAPITSLLEYDLSPSAVYEAAEAAAELIGNANARLSRMRREKIIGAINKSLLPLVQDEEKYTRAPPLLFGPDFAERSKAFTEQVQALRSGITSTRAREGGGRKQFFRRGPPSKRAGHRGGRGGASSRYSKPSQQQKP